MRRIDYTLQLDGEPFCIAIHDIGGSEMAAKETPAIKITNISGWYFSGFPADALGSVRLFDSDNRLVEVLRQHPEDFLTGQCEGWKLMRVDVEPGVLRLEYCRPEDDNSDWIELDIRESQIRDLEIALEVPHLDQRPNTVYHLSLSQQQIRSAEQPYSCRTVITESLPALYQRNLFIITSEKPTQLSATSYVDL